MIAAIYARKSTEQNVADEAKSVTRQVENARAYAATRGWTVDDRYVYVDDGISGAEFKRRPGLQRLMGALAPKPPFGVLIVSEQKSIGREASEMGYWNKTRKRPVTWGQVDQQPRPEAEWLRTPAEHLRLVPEDLWRRVQARRHETEGRAARFASGRLSGRPPKHGAQNLLAGLATCAL